jgi:hypothetical protein
MRWGYPYVLEQWRFHLTLTARLLTRPNARRWRALLRQRFGASPTGRCRSTTSASSASPVRPAVRVLARFRLGGGRRVSAEAWRAADEGLGRFIERAVIHDRHRAGHVEVVPAARSRSAAAPASSRPRQQAFFALGGAVISTGTVSSSMPSIVRKCSREPLTTTARPACARPRSRGRS